MGAIKAFFGANKLIAIILLIFVSIQGLTLIVGSVVAASSFMDAISGNGADANRCTGDYKQVITGIFTDPSIDKTKMLAGCLPDKTDPGYDVTLWLQIIEQATDNKNNNVCYDADKVKELEQLAEEAANGGANLTAGSSSFTQPVFGTLLDGFGPRPVISEGGYTSQPFHYGQDIAVPDGTPVKAAASGKVVYAGAFGSLGNWVLIHADGGGDVEIGTGHAEKILVKVGQHVTEGQIIQLSGHSGIATGPHVHVEVHVNGTKIDPVPFFQAHGAPLGAAGSNGSTGVNTSAVQAEFAALEAAHHDCGIWQAIIDYATDKINGVSYNADIGDAIVAAAEAHVGDDYVASRTGWNANSQNYCAKSPKSVGGPSVNQCGLDDASLTGLAMSKALNLSLAGGIKVAPWNGSVATEENYLNSGKHGVVINLNTIMPGDLLFVSYSGDLSQADHVVIYAGTTKQNGRDVKHWIEAANDDSKIKDVVDDTPEFLQDYSYEVIRPYTADSGDGTAPVTGTGAVADAKRYAQQRITAHASWGWSDAADWSSLEKMWTKESGWRVNAENDACHTAAPAAPEYQAYGIPQMCPGSNMGNVAAGGASDWKTNYKTQVEAGLYYIHSRYGSPHEAWTFWQSHGWY